MPAKVMEKGCPGRKGVPKTVWGPRSQVKNILEGGESEQPCQRLMVAQTRWQPWVTLTRTGQWTGG